MTRTFVHEKVCGRKPKFPRLLSILIVSTGVPTQKATSWSGTGKSFAMY